MVVTNMKSYLCTLLLFLLLFLVDKSLSVSIPPSFKAIAYKMFRDKAINYLWGKTLDGIKNPQPNYAPPVNANIPGLFRIKQYLFQFGYLEDTGPYNDVLDMRTMSSIRAYQNFFNLQVTGDLSTQTIQQISLPRCGVPDFRTSDVSWPIGKFPVGKSNLTYGFLLDSRIPENSKRVFRKAFRQWSSQNVVNFMESYNNDGADIMIGFYDFRQEDNDAVIGVSVIMRWRSGMKTAEIRLDGSNKLWVLPTDTPSFKQGIFDLESAVMHQIGHLLGLRHSNNQYSIMYPAILPSQQRKVQIIPSDIQALHQLYYYTNGYSAISGSFALFGSSSGLVITTFSLGFLCMALLH